MERTKSATVDWYIRKRDWSRSRMAQLNQIGVKNLEEENSMINQLSGSRSNVSRHNERKIPRGRARASGVGWRGMSTHLKFGVVMVAALMALVV